MIKKILTILLCITLLCPLLATASDTENLYFEIAEYNDAVQFLSAFDIIDRENPSLDTSDWTISRGEFVYLAILCLGYESDMQFSAFENPFMDVSDDHIYAKAITYAANTNLIGELGKFFQPDIPLTMEFAARLGVNMTGRDVMLGTKNTYLSLAVKAHLFDGVEIYGNSQISRGGALQFLKNVLTVEVVTYNSISTNGEKGDIRVEEDANLLSTVLKYERRRGILTADGMTTVFGTTPDDGYVSVDGTPYLLLSGSAVGMAGRYVEYYITEYEGETAVKYIEEYRNDIMTIDAASITGFDPISMKYRALIEEKGRDLSVSRNAYISYNHSPYYNPDYMKPQKGSVTFIDHNSDNVYDVVMILEFTNTIVDYYSSYSETIYDLDSRKEAVTNKNLDDIDLSDSKNVFLTNTDNEFTEPGLLERYSIVTVYKSADGKKVRMIVSTEKITGNLTAIDDEGVVTIGSRECKLSADFRSDKNSLELGAKYVCYLDARGEIAYMTSETGVLAYLINAGKGKGLSTEIQLQALDEETGVVNIYQLAKKVKYQTPTSESKESRKDIYENYLLDSSDKFIRKMALIDFNDNGEINQITMPMDIDTYDKVFTATDYPFYKLSYLYNSRPAISGTGDKVEYKDTGDNFSRWLILGSGMKNFRVPPKTDEIDDIDALLVEKKASYSSGDTIDIKNTEFYSKNLKDIAVQYALEYSTASKAATLSESYPFVVTKIVGCNHEKLGDTYRLTLQGTDGLRTLYTKDQSVILKENLASETDKTKMSDATIGYEKTQIQAGDIIIYSTTASGYIDSILLCWDSRSNIEDTSNERFGRETLTTPPADWNDAGPMGGIVKRKSGNIIEVDIDGDAGIQRMSWGVDQRTVLVQFYGKKVEVTSGITANELIPGDRIVFPVPTTTGKVYMPIVYRR